MKTILITGATDGIGLQTAKNLAPQGHKLLLHGRSPEKLEAARQVISNLTKITPITFVADFSNLEEVGKLAQKIQQKFPKLDAIINNAGVLKTSHTITSSGLDIRFVVNTLAPYLLTRKLLSSLSQDARVVNLASAAQAAVDTDALLGRKQIDDMSAYSQSKLALIIWSMEMAREIGPDGPSVIAVNPGSLLASKMVKEGFGMAGKDLNIGANVLVEAVTGNSFSSASGKYYDNDSRQFSDPHPSALDQTTRAKIIESLDGILEEYL